MCTQTHPAVPGVDKLPADGKLFIDGKNRPLSIADHDQAQAAIEVGVPAVVVTNLNGEQTTIPRERVQSLVRPVEKPNAITVDPYVFNGRGITLTSLAHYNRQDDPSIGPFEVPEGVDEATCVVVEVEDLASAAVLVYDLATKTVVFQNPASHERAIKRYIRAITLLAEAETLENTEGEGALAHEQPPTVATEQPPVIPEPRTADEVGKDSLPE